MQVYVEGRLSHSIYQDNAGETKVSLEVNSRDVQIVQDPQQQQTTPAPGQQQTTPAPEQQQTTPAPVNTDEDEEQLPW